MKTIIINESQENKIKNSVIEEMYGGQEALVGYIKDYLDNNFSRANATITGKDGRPKTEEIVAWLDKYKQIYKTLTDVQLFYILQDEFKSVMPNKQDRDDFLKDVMVKWYNKKISKYNSLLN
jgi:hypothetical protein